MVALLLVQTAVYADQSTEMIRLGAQSADNQAFARSRPTREQIEAHEETQRLDDIEHRLDLLEQQ